MCPRTCALGLSSSLLSENKKKTTKVCEIGDRESFFGALFILWIHGKNSHIRTTCKLGGHDLFLGKFFFFFCGRCGVCGNYFFNWERKRVVFGGDLWLWLVFLSHFLNASFGSFFLCWSLFSGAVICCCCFVDTKRFVSIPFFFFLFILGLGEGEDAFNESYLCS